MAFYDRFSDLLSSIAAEHRQLGRQFTVLAEENQRLLLENQELRALIVQAGSSGTEAGAHAELPSLKEGLLDIPRKTGRHLVSHVHPKTGDLLLTTPSAHREVRIGPEASDGESYACVSNEAGIVSDFAFVSEQGRSEASCHTPRSESHVLVFGPRETNELNGSTETFVSAEKSEKNDESKAVVQFCGVGSATLRRAGDVIITRLMVRLGIRSTSELVAVYDLHTAVRSLGLINFDVADISYLVRRMNEITGFVLEDSTESARFKRPSLVSAVSSGKSKSTQSRSGHLHKWKKALSRSAPSLAPSSLSRTTTSLDLQAEKIPFEALAEFLVSDQERQRLGEKLAGQAFAIKEVLLSGGANRLVADLTNVRVDDLAAPPPKSDWRTYIEPFVGIMILLNGITLGVQTDAQLEDWIGWLFIECVFTVFFFAEMVYRICMSGLHDHFCGPEAGWSFLDAFIVFAAIVDTVMTSLSYTSNSSRLSPFMRTIRLTRLCRLVRVFRLGVLRELNVMIRGLLAGFRTLFWAIVLLFFTIYILAVFATQTLGTSDADERIVREELFSSVPRAMLSCFRCFVGDCTTSRGEPIVKILSDAFGVPFVLVYLSSFTLVTLGLFNLIMAIYVEITVAAAKRTDDNDRHRAMRESIRVAQVTRKLLKKFCSAQRMINRPSSTNIRHVTTVMRGSQDEELDENVSISKELFLLVVQDQEVQHLMDELDIPPDRADLFDTLDADGSGSLHPTELVHGLLKVRGEARKSDIIASLLAVRAVQDMIRSLIVGQEKLIRHFDLGERKNSRHIWDERRTRRITVSKENIYE